MILYGTFSGDADYVTDLQKLSFLDYNDLNCNFASMPYLKTSHIIENKTTLLYKYNLNGVTKFEEF